MAILKLYMNMTIYVQNTDKKWKKQIYNSYLLQGRVNDIR